MSVNETFIVHCLFMVLTVQLFSAFVHLNYAKHSLTYNKHSVRAVVHARRTVCTYVPMSSQSLNRMKKTYCLRGRSVVAISNNSEYLLFLAQFVSSLYSSDTFVNCPLAQLHYHSSCIARGPAGSSLPSQVFF